MSNNLVKVEDDFQEENEINIYDIINIFIKNIKLFIKVSILGIVLTCLFIGIRIVFFKNNILTIEYRLDYAELESYLNGKVFYPRKEPSQILLENKYLEELFEDSELKAYYEENVKEDRDNPNIKRQFLIEKKLLEDEPKRIKTKKEDKEEGIIPDSYKITVRVNKREDKDKKLSLSIMNTYLKIVKEYYNETIFKYIEDRRVYSDERLPVLRSLLEENAVITSSLNFDKNEPVENNFLRYIYPTKVSNVDTYYPEYVKLETENQAIKTISGLGLNNIDNFIKYDTSIITEKEKTGNLIKLGIGIFLSLCLGVLVIFIKEFMIGYKKNKENL
ncbi:hypothetical protein [Fusobacterium animalis]|uniref:hypothetical protein n=1 Tax=Fusobacterium animalis TaxID=76859 RepID=UPI0034DE988D